MDLMHLQLQHAFQLCIAARGALSEEWRTSPVPDHRGYLWLRYRAQTRRTMQRSTAKRCVPELRPPCGPPLRSESNHECESCDQSFNSASHARLYKMVLHIGAGRALRPRAPSTGAGPIALGSFRYAWAWSFYHQRHPSQLLWEAPTTNAKTATCPLELRVPMPEPLSFCPSPYQNHRGSST